MQSHGKAWKHEAAATHVWVGGEKYKCINKTKLHTVLPTCRSELVGHIADPDHIVVLPKTVVPPVVHVLVLVIFIHPTHYAVPNQGIGICDLNDLKFLKKYKG